MREGKGKLIQYVEDLKHDYFKEECKEIYEGLFKANKFHGFGKISYADGITYEGYWLNGKKDGKGSLIKGN